MFARDLHEETPADLLVERLRCDARAVSTAQAEFYASMHAVAEAARDEADEFPEFAPDEVRAALTWTRRAADVHVELAWQLCERLPAVWDALQSGDIDLARARVIVGQTVHLDEAVARQVVDEILVGAGDRTTGQLSARLRRLVIETDTESAKKRYDQGVEERRVTVEANDDGTANLCAWNLPADRANATMRRINAIARSTKTAANSRTADQVRADVFLDLLTGSAPAAPNRRATVDIQVDLTTLLGLDDQTAELPGWGPVIADVARQVVADQAEAEWRITVTGESPHETIWNGITRRRPTTAQRRHVQTRKRTCVFPDVGCPPPILTSTTPSITPKVDLPTPTTSPRCADTTTGSNTKAAGNSPDETTPTHGPAPSVRSTSRIPKDPDRLRRGRGHRHI